MTDKETAVRPRTRALPEVWVTQDGRRLPIRHMSDQHIIDTVKMLRNKGYISLREWNEDRPQPPVLANCEWGNLFVEEGYFKDVVKWARQKHHCALDAFALEQAFRRRHKIHIADRPQRLSVGMPLDVTPPSAAAALLRTTAQNWPSFTSTPSAVPSRDSGMDPEDMYPPTDH